MGLEQASWRCLDWGPDSIAASCNCWNGLVCWIGLAKLRSSERAEESRGSTLKAKAKAGKEQRASKLPEKRLATTAMPLKQWYLVLAYDGTDFAGWQRQSEGVRTLQGEVEKALSLVFRAEVRTVGASRTDSGVHARGQVCHFEAPEVLDETSGQLDNNTLLRRLRLTLPPAIFVVHIGKAPTTFHSRLSSIKKNYSYRLSTTAVMPFEARQCWTCGELDLEAIQTAINILHNKQMDYSAFTTGENELEYHGHLTKTVQLAMKVDRPMIFLQASSDRFLYKMVRRLVGALVEVGKGRLAPLSIATATRQQIPTAPPSGLSLDEVVYPNDVQSSLSL